MALASPFISSIASTRASPGLLDLTWMTIPHTPEHTVDHYSVEYATTNTFIDAVAQVVPRADTPDTKCGLAGLTHGPSGPRYWIRVRAVNTLGSVGEASNVISGYWRELWEPVCA
jgi:hypothetical protein